MADANMAIMLKFLTGKSVCFPNVKPTERIKDIKMMLCEGEGIPIEAQRIFYAGRQLQNERSLAEQGIKHNDILLCILRLNHYSRRKIEWQSPTTTLIIKTLTRLSIELRDVKLTDTVMDIKIRIQKRMRIYHGIQKIIYKGKQLQDDKTLDEEGVNENETLRLVIKVGPDSSFLNTVNDLLCDDDIKLVNQTNGLSSDELFNKMMIKWQSSCIYNEYTTLNIENVFKIEKNYEQNMKIFNVLLSTKKNRGREDVLFHGTSFGNIAKIINTGFNRDYNVKSRYGKGTYFSNKARIAARYCTKYDKENNFYTAYAMLACKAYIGEITKGREHMNDHELYKEDKVTQYDSLVNDLDNPTIFVINRDYHVVPCFVIVFTAGSNIYC